MTYDIGVNNILITGKNNKLIIVSDQYTSDAIMNYLMPHQIFKTAVIFWGFELFINSTLTWIPDIVMLDMALPGIDKQLWCNIIKQKFSACKVIAINIGEEMENQLKMLGFDECICRGETDPLQKIVDVLES